jgi:phosphohistidine phosphatase
MDAAVAGRKLADSGLPFDLALCSTAVRTRETWKIAVHELPHRPKTVYEERIYEASPGELIAVLNELPEDAQNVVLIGHNPGVQGLAEILAGGAEGDARERMSRLGFPAAAFAVLSFEGSWKSLEPGVGTLADYWAPTE